MPVHLLKEFLDRNDIKYVAVTHSTAYTAQEIAALTHIKGKYLAKSVIVRLDDRLAMAVLPASFQVDLQALSLATGAKAIEIAPESDFRARFPGCETGAMPPFGNLYGMQVYVDENLTRDQEIAFNAGSHKELIRMSYRDFAMLARPVVLRFAVGRAAYHAA